MEGVLCPRCVTDALPVNATSSHAAPYDLSLLKPELRREGSQEQTVARMPRDTASSPRFLHCKRLLDSQGGRRRAAQTLGTSPGCHAI